MRFSGGFPYIAPMLEGTSFADAIGFLLQLAEPGPLGQPGDTLAFPFDTVIMPATLTAHAWQREELEFLARVVQPEAAYTLVDVGANIGLFSRQAALRFPGIARLVCAEPDPTNFKCLAFNLADLGPGRAALHNLALSDRDGTATFFRDAHNAGNYSMNPDAMRDRAFATTAVHTADAAAWAAAAIPAEGRLIWKSDTQGHDEVIVSRLPPPFWARVDIAILELWRIRKPAFDAAAFAERLAAFPQRSIGLEGQHTVDQVLAYLAGDDQAHQDLYLWR